MNEKFYKFLEWVRVLLPLYIAFHTTVSEVWHWPYQVQIIATLGALNALVCGVMKYASGKFFEDKEIVDVGRQEIE